MCVRLRKYSIKVGDRVACAWDVVTHVYGSVYRFQITREGNALLLMLKGTQLFVCYKLLPQLGYRLSTASDWSIQTTGETLSSSVLNCQQIQVNTYRRTLFPRYLPPSLTLSLSPSSPCSRTCLIPSPLLLIKLTIVLNRWVDIHWISWSTAALPDPPIISSLLIVDLERMVLCRHVWLLLQIGAWHRPREEKGGNMACYSRDS